VVTSFFAPISPITAQTSILVGKSVAFKKAARFGFVDAVLEADRHITVGMNGVDYANFRDAGFFTNNITATSTVSGASLVSSAGVSGTIGSFSTNIITPLVQNAGSPVRVSGVGAGFGAAPFQVEKTAVESGIVASFFNAAAPSTAQSSILVGNSSAFKKSARFGFIDAVLEADRRITIGYPGANLADFSDDRFSVNRVESSTMRVSGVSDIQTLRVLDYSSTRDFYAEGTFLPAWATDDGSAFLQLTYGARGGRWHRVGAVITVDFFMTVNSFSTTGSGCGVSNILPFGAGPVGSLPVIAQPPDATEVPGFSKPYFLSFVAGTSNFKITSYSNTTFNSAASTNVMAIRGLFTYISVI